MVFPPQAKQRYSLTDDAVIDEAIDPVIVDETGAKVTLALKDAMSSWRREI